VLISILIPCFNAERWIAGAIDSALAQTWPHKEVIVVDDGSTDGSVEIIRSYGDRIRWEARAHAGANPTRNRLLELASGEWLQYLDADDYLLPEKVEKYARSLNDRDDTDILYGPATLELWSGGSVHREITPIPEPRDPWILLVRWYLPQTGAPLWRKQAIVDVGGWKPDQPCAQEHELYLRLLIGGKRFTYQPENGAVYRYWGTSTISRRDNPETRRRRLEVLDRAEEFLRTTNALSAERLHAINVTRFSTARLAWHDDRDEARAIMSAVSKSEPGFVPSGPAAPPRYQFLYRWLGFDASEQLAHWFRKGRLS